MASLLNWKKAKMENMTTLLLGALPARGKVGLMMNLPRAGLQPLMEMLPAMQTPTVSSLADTDWVAVEITADERPIRDLIPKLLSAGATGIIEYPLDKVIA